MKIQQKNPLAHRFNTLRELMKQHPLDLEKIDTISRETLNILGGLTLKGVQYIEKTHIDTWKSRIWMIIEKANLLPEYKDEVLDDVENWDENPETVIDYEEEDKNIDIDFEEDLGLEFNMDIF